jgi:hypothetical protein
LKIVVLGSHPATRDKAPFADKAWEIWACSTHNAPPHASLPRITRWYEVHEPVEDETRPADYQGWLDELHRTRPDRLWMMDRRRFPEANAYPYEVVVEEFGPYFLDTSSIAYMMAHAILTMMRIGDAENTLAVFGVMQASAGEYTYQLPGLQHFATAAWERGITVAVPEECRVLVPRKLKF